LCNILGLSNGHDANVSVVTSDGTRLLLELERIVRRKHAAGYVAPIVERALETSGLTLEAIDAVAVVPPIWPEAGYDWSIIGGSLPGNPSETTVGEIELLGHRKRAYFVPHHVAHASYSYFSAGVGRADVFTADAGGGQVDASFSRWSEGRLIEFIPLPELHIGSLWSVLASELFGDIFAAGKVMGLAAYGSANCVQELERAFRTSVDGLPGCRSAWQAGSVLGKGTGWRSARARNMAASLQEFTEQVSLEVVERLGRPERSDALCMGGGLALNGYLNTRLSTETAYRKFCFPAAVHDGGLSLGAALKTYVEVTRRHVAKPLSPFLGLSPDGTIDADSPFTDGSVLAAAELLRDGGVVAVCQGRAEAGPRALGHRSIIAGVDQPWVRDYLNSRVKDRESFRPVSPAILEDDAAAFLENKTHCNGEMTQIGRLSAEGLAR